MGGLWPEANQVQKTDGWTLSVSFLEAVKNRMDETDSKFSGSLEVIENCLLAASKVEIEYYNQLIRKELAKIITPSKKAEKLKEKYGLFESKKKDGSRTD